MHLGQVLSWVVEAQCDTRACRQHSDPSPTAIVILANMNNTHKDTVNSIKVAVGNPHRSLLIANITVLADPGEQLRARRGPRQSAIGSERVVRLTRETADLRLRLAHAIHTWGRVRFR